MKAKAREWGETKSGSPLKFVTVWSHSATGAGQTERFDATSLENL
jgi:hypothetical protein